ncbi:HD family phosphohydrolase [Marseilla massiliensis]|uniref:HDIG domain-containing protein n=1 Tax=Marseilla massiliensis TaxID=1841864 RepID=A0A939B786_9BACT|nr:HDIG domain-containing metalloprotein [Marseilla massiliensis]MBM6673287.1 HDIG domain-containing protein [Marseilla massiliensis]
MIRFDNANTHHHGRWLVYTALVVVTVALIVSFLPRNSGPQFRYDVGKPWMYSSLIAKFDFPIYKTEETIKEEQDSITDAFEPYYNYDAKVEQEQVKRFIDNYKDGIPGLPAEYVSTIADRLHRLYLAGVMDALEYSKISRDTTSMIRIVSGKKATSVEIMCTYSTMTAYEQLFSDPKLAAQRQILQRCNLNEYIQPNIIYDEERSEGELGDMLSGIPLASGMVLSGQKIIDRGEIVDDYTYRVLNSFERETKRRSASASAVPSTIAGQVLFVGTLILLFTTYLRLFRKDYLDKPRSIAMLYVMITVFPILVSLMITHNVLSVYILPFAIAPIFIRVFVDSRTAFTAHVTMVLICAAAVKYQYEFIIVQLVAGFIAIYSLRELSQRAEIFKTALLVTLGSSGIYFALQLMQDNSILTMDHSMYAYFAVNGVLLLFAYPLMLVIEKTFGFISNVTLIELSNTNKKLLRSLSEVAPGTFQHSVMVGNLAAEIANKIGAKSQLVRTGALYHDIGKMKNSVYFTENQMGGINPLDALPRIDAAQVVISHVTDGLKMAERYNLPGVIKDFIKTHHGTGKTKYFYISYKNEHPDEPVDDTLFTYPGPDPFTREQAVLMMADTVEAAARSLKEYTEESISNLVNKLIDQQVEDGFFRTCPITFHDIAVAKQVLIERLKAIYHTRTSYPELNKKGKEEQQTQPASQYASSKKQDCADKRHEKP